MRKFLTAIAIAAALALGSLNVAPAMAYSFDEKMQKDKKKSEDKEMKEDKKKSEDKEMKSEDKEAKKEKSSKSSKKKTLYSRLGGKKAITAVVDEFINVVGGDNRINKFFADTVKDAARLQALKDNLIAQICQVTGGPCKYKGKDMVTAHKGMGVTDADFTALVEDLVAALNKFNVPEAEKNELLGLLGPLKDQIVGQ